MVPGRRVTFYIKVLKKSFKIRLRLFKFDLKHGLVDLYQYCSNIVLFFLFDLIINRLHGTFFFKQLYSGECIRVMMALLIHHCSSRS